MTPDSYPITIPQGGSFGLTGTIGNPTGEPIITDVWVGVKYMGDFLQLWYFPNLTLATGQYISAHLTQNVPFIAPLGVYEYRAHCGDLSSWVICDRDSFEFTVTGAGLSRGSDEWVLNGGWDDVPDAPVEYSLSANYPNPFNNTTQISFGIAQAGNVRFDVYNMLGQRVEILVDSHMDIGNYSVTWDASNYSSGIYFYKLTARQGPGLSTAGDKVFTKRMTLLK